MKGFGLGWVWMITRQLSYEVIFLFMINHLARGLYLFSVSTFYALC